MDRKLIWAVKASSITPTKKNLEELAHRDDLFDESLIDVKSKAYKFQERSFARTAEKGYSIVTFIDKEYPEKLRNITFPPPVLYVRGNVAILNGIVYAGIVGSRKCDTYGKQMANNIAREVGATGAGIVSGGAEGVDAAAHDGALRVNAPTIAVFGSGINVDYPKCNEELFRRIEEKGGAIITEFPYGTPPRSKNFPVRNRIIAALSEVIVLARAGTRSGGLITVNQALDMNKTVFAVPGNIDSPLSIGANALIRDGAIPLISPMDVIDELIEHNPDYFVREREEIPYVKTVPVMEKSIKTTAKMQLTEYEEEIVNIINEGYNTQATMENKVSFEATRLTALLGMMEIKGILKKKSDKSYIVIGGKC